MMIIIKTRIILIFIYYIIIITIIIDIEWRDSIDDCIITRSCGDSETIDSSWC
jgi:hypothetical protein